MTHSGIQVVSVNVGKLCVLPGVRNAQPTGIVKLPVAGPVKVGRDGLEGDHIGSIRDHGGPDQAVYLFSLEDYAWWEEELQRRLEPGVFGENLTVTGWKPETARVGDLWDLDGLQLELSGPRIPCATLAARMGIPTLVKRFAQANRAGAYARVLHAGTVEAGRSIKISRAGSDHPGIYQLFALWHQKEKSLELIRQALASPIAWRARIDLERWRTRSEGVKPCG